VMVEGSSGMAALPDILATPGLDGVFIGPFDLSQALGVPGDVEHASVLAGIESIVASTERAGLVTAVFAPTPSLARRWLQLGVQVVAVGYDTAMALDGFRAVRRGIDSM